MSCVLFLPKTKDIVIAEVQTQEKVKYSLISPNFTGQINYQEKYNIMANNVSSFTPFDLGQGERKAGKSFGLLSTERNQIVSQYVNLDEVDVPKQQNSLYFFVNFDTIYLHNLTIILEFENGAKLTWALTGNELVSLVKKTTTASILSLPFAWNHLELPFVKAIQSGEIYQGNNLNTISKMIIDFTSETIKSEDEEVYGDIEQEFDITYSNLLFYDIYLSESTGDDYNVLEKQNYNIYDFNFYSEEFINSICVGDTITLPSSYKTVVNYAWQGYKDLRNDNTGSVVWQIIVKTPDSKNPIIYPAFGDKLTFNKEGSYEIFYQCKDISISNEEPVVSGSVKINARVLKPIYFDKSTFNIQTGKTYKLNVYTSIAFNTIKDIQFKTSSDSIDLIYNNGVLSVTTNVPGEYKIDVILKGVRAVLNQEKEYTQTFKITVTNKTVNQKKTQKIILYVSLSIFGVIFVGVLIKKFIEARKYDVK